MKKTIFTLSLICLFFNDIKAQVEYKVLNPTRNLQIPQNTIPNTFGLGGRGMYLGVALNF